MKLGDYLQEFAEEERRRTEAEASRTERAQQEAERKRQLEKEQWNLEENKRPLLDTIRRLEDSGVMELLSELSGLVSSTVEVSPVITDILEFDPRRVACVQARVVWGRRDEGQWHDGDPEAPGNRPYFTKTGESWYECVVEAPIERDEIAANVRKAIGSGKKITDIFLEATWEQDCGDLRRSVAKALWEAGVRLPR